MIAGRNGGTALLCAAVAILIGGLPGCSTMQYTPNLTSSGMADVQVLYDYPRTPYDNLGIVDFDFYRPGFRQPTLTDALDDLKSKVRAVGGNALIVRDQRIGQQNNRFLHISAEVLRTKP
jgi:hypothetical protein